MARLVGLNAWRIRHVLLLKLPGYWIQMFEYKVHLQMGTHVIDCNLKRSWRHGEKMPFAHTLSVDPHLSGPNMIT